jgi:hypothetical protein
MALIDRFRWYIKHKAKRPHLLDSVIAEAEKLKDKAVGKGMKSVSKTYAPALIHLDIEKQGGTKINDDTKKRFHASSILTKAEIEEFIKDDKNRKYSTISSFHKRLRDWQKDPNRLKVKQLEEERIKKQSEIEEKRRKSEKEEEESEEPELEEPEEKKEREEVISVFDEPEYKYPISEEMQRMMREASSRVSEFKEGKEAEEKERLKTEADLRQEEAEKNARISIGKAQSEEVERKYNEYLTNKSERLYTVLKGFDFKKSDAIPAQLMHDYANAKNEQEEKAIIAKNMPAFEHVRVLNEERKKAGSKKKDIEAKDVLKKLMAKTNKSIKLRMSIMQNLKQAKDIVPEKAKKRYSKRPHNPALKEELAEMERPVSEKPKRRQINAVNHLDGLDHPKAIQVII